MLIIVDYAVSSCGIALMSQSSTLNIPVLSDLLACNKSLGFGRYAGLSTTILITLAPLCTPSFITIFSHKYFA